MSKKTIMRSLFKTNWHTSKMETKQETQNHVTVAKWPYENRYCKSSEHTMTFSTAKTETSN